ncbi:hypothetical protein FRC07_007029 [Ceratobasidium sp. 392]|nr:hypothetical protein FRC07_007029 [Ceratobasidium sp. 392]
MTPTELLKFVPSKKGHAKASVRYTSRLAFGYMETEDNNLIEPSAWVDVQTGDVATITGGLHSQCFGEVTHRTNNEHMICKNRSKVRVDLSLDRFIEYYTDDRIGNSSQGLVKGEGVNERFEPVHYWDNVGTGSNVTAEFTPVLTAYVTGSYQGTEYLRGEVDSDAIWSQSLDELDDVTGWNFVEDPETGFYSIEQADSP